MKLNHDDRLLLSRIQQRLGEVLQQRQTKFDGPSELVLNISEGCNLVCPYCFAYAGKYTATNSTWMTEREAFPATRRCSESIETSAK